jgi:hypothetical protein
VAVDLGGVWSLTYAAEIGALKLAQLPGADEDFALTAAAADLGDAVDALETVAPDAPRTGLVVDFGDAPLDEIQACRTALAGLILSALATLGQAATRPGLEPAVIAAAGSALARLTSAYWRITGTLP